MDEQKMNGDILKELEEIEKIETEDIEAVHSMGLGVVSIICCQKNQYIAMRKY